jgi:hypothetical protein
MKEYMMDDELREQTLEQIDEALEYAGGISELAFERVGDDFIVEVFGDDNDVIKTYKLVLEDHDG